MAVSALEENGLQTAWDEMTELSKWRKDNGFFTERRAEQQRYWFEEEVRQALLAQLQQGEAKAVMSALGDRVATGRLSVSKAAEEMLAALKA